MIIKAVNFWIGLRYRDTMSKELKSPRSRRSRFIRKKTKNYVYILRKYLPLGELDIAVSTNKQMILKRAKALLKNLPEEIWENHRPTPFHQGRSDEELRQFLKDNPDQTYYDIVIHDDNTGEIVDSHIVEDRTTLPGY